MGTRAERVVALLLCATMAASAGACTMPSAPSPATPATVVEPTPTPTPQPDPSITAIITDLADATIGVYGVRTKVTFAVDAVGLKLAYQWQQRPAKTKKWKTIAGAKSAKYTAKASAWASGTQFRVIVTGTNGKVTSAVATLTVVKPTNTPAKDAEKAFGLTGLRQGVDLSAYQYPAQAARRVNLKAVRTWTGKNGFALLRTGSGDRPIDYDYTDVCTGKRGNTKERPATQDCAYRILASGAASNRLSLGHYWFNGWISSIDTSEDQLFAGGHTPTDSARLFVAWLKRDGRYSKSSTDPLVLDVEDGNTRTKKTSDGTSQQLELRHWTPDEATEFLTAVREQLVKDGYKANLYVYLNAKTVAELDEFGTGYAWAPVAEIARLWVASWGTDNGRIPDEQPLVGPWEEHGGWSIWQYTSQARIAGARVTAVDADVAKADAWTPLR